jgi:Prephenate dehydrogenase
MPRVPRYFPHFSPTSREDAEFSPDAAASAAPRPARWDVPSSCSTAAGTTSPPFQTPPAESPHEESRFEDYAQGSITDANHAAERLIQAAHCVLLCIPEEATIEAIPVLARLVSSDKLIVDIASIKSRIEQAVRLHAPSSGYLSIHPMFGPLIDFSSRNICIIHLKKNRCSEWFTELLSRWGACLTVLSAEEHDRAAAYGQVISHAAILAFTATVVDSPVPFWIRARRLIILATVPHKTPLCVRAWLEVRGLLLRMRCPGK